MLPCVMLLRFALPYRLLGALYFYTRILPHTSSGLVFTTGRNDSFPTSSEHESALGVRQYPPVVIVEKTFLEALPLPALLSFAHPCFVWL